MMNRTIVVVCFFFLCHISCEGFDLTLETRVRDDPSSPNSLCGEVRCREFLQDSSQSGNYSRQINRVSLYRARVETDGSTGPWQELTTVTSENPTVYKVFEGMRSSGQITGNQAMISLAMVTDCQQSQFACVAVYVDNHGHSSIKKSLVGETLDAQRDFDHWFPEAISSSTQSGGSPSDSGQLSVNEIGTQLAALVQVELDGLEHRLKDHIQDLQRGLEDKMEGIQTAIDDRTTRMNNKMDARFGASDLRFKSLEYKIASNLVYLETRVAEVLDQVTSTSAANSAVLDQLRSTLDALAAKQDITREQVDTCVTEVGKISSCEEETGQKLSGQMSAVAASVESMGRNLTSSLEMATRQCALTASGQDTQLTALVSSVANISSLTSQVLTEVNEFSKDFHDGAMEQVDEFFDVLGTGNKEWRLAFRGTAYIDVKVYPAYLHGTGIPVHVEEGCKQFSRSRPCVNHYRNRDAFDNWARIDQVLFAVYQGDQMVHHVTFNGTDSTVVNWFSPDRVLSSTWVDLPDNTFNRFSIFGEQHDSVQRRFFINFDYNRGCDGYRGWFFAQELPNVGCASEVIAAIPLFMYAKGNTMAVWSSEDAGRADAIGVYLKYE